MNRNTEDHFWPLIGLCAALAAAIAFVILASALAGLLAHATPIWVAPSAAGTLLARLLPQLSDPARAWPAADRRGLPGTGELQAILVISLITVLAACALGWRLARHLRDATPRKRAARWATAADLAELRVRRPQRGRITLGYHRRAMIAAEERASVMVVGPTQSGKTTGLVVPSMSEWDGPVLATSIKTDLLVKTLAARSQIGEARVFDPTQATTLGHAVWSPLSAATTWTGARRTAAALLGVGDNRANHSADDAFWRPAGARYLAALLFAATKAADLTMADVLHWIATADFDEPTKLLDGAKDGGTAPAVDSIQSVKGADHRFASSLLQTIATALDPWQEPQVAGATMGESRIGADWLLGGANTLYIVAPANDQRRLSGLFAALVSHIVAGAYERSARTGRPIDPALLLALDEVANIAPLPNLDEIASSGPGQGVHLLCVLQNISQAYDRWGRDRAETIIANHRARLFCSGIGDRATLEYLRGTLGEEEIARISTQQRGIVPGARTRSTEHRPFRRADGGVPGSRRKSKTTSHKEGSMHSVQLTGRLTRDPELVQLESGSVCRLRLAIENMGRNETGYVDVSTFGKAGEAAARVLSKGWLVAVDGRLDYRHWVADDGSNRSTIGVVGNVEFLAAPRATAATVEEVAA